MWFVIVVVKYINLIDGTWFDYFEIVRIVGYGIVGTLSIPNVSILGFPYGTSQSYKTTVCPICRQFQTFLDWATSEPIFHLFL